MQGNFLFPQFFIINMVHFYIAISIVSHISQLYTHAHFNASLGHFHELKSGRENGVEMVAICLAGIIIIHAKTLQCCALRDWNVHFFSLL